jgi:hypothetical protein
MTHGSRFEISTSRAARRRNVGPEPVLAVALLLALAGCGGGEDPAGLKERVVSSRAYKGHVHDLDMNNLVAAYPEIAGSGLDDCQTCHTGGEVTSKDKTRFRGACDYCHYVRFPDPDATGTPTTYRDTLNPFGLAYLEAGRDADAVKRLRNRDSDGDGFANGEEIRELRYPGSADSLPGQPWAKTLILDVERLRAMPAHTQFLLANSHSQRSDSYASYTGVKIRDLLLQVGVNPNEIFGITVIAADGFTRDFDAEAINGPYPNGLFFAGLDTDTLGTGCGFVDYTAPLPDGLVDGAEIPGEAWLMLAYARDGGAMSLSHLDPFSGKIRGEGPLRLIVPQSRPGLPDRGSDHSPSGCEDGYDYEDDADHNAGSMARAVVAIRINPMPEGYEEFDARNGGWAYLEAGQLVVYGKGI